MTIFECFRTFGVTSRRTAPSAPPNSAQICETLSGLIVDVAVYVLNRMQELGRPSYVRLA
jgi:hypothetical protein